MSSASVRKNGGFSLIELLIATSLMLLVMVSVFQAMHPAYGSFRAEPEMTDLQQRLRVATETLTRELLAAGGGTFQGQNAGPLDDFFASILPFRQGRRNADPPGTHKPLSRKPWWRSRQPSRSISIRDVPLQIRSAASGAA